MWHRYAIGCRANQMEGDEEEAGGRGRDRDGGREREQVSKNQTDLSESTGLTTCLPASRYATGWGSLRTVSNLR